MLGRSRCVQMFLLNHHNPGFNNEIPPEFDGGVHLFICTAIRDRVSPAFIESRNCVTMTFTAECPPAQDQ